MAFVLLGITDLFEALSWGIIGQQINLTYAYTLKRRLVETFGSYVEWNGRKHWIFLLLKQLPIYVRISKI